MFLVNADRWKHVQIFPKQNGDFMEQQPENSSSFKSEVVTWLHGTICQYITALNAECYILSEARWRDLEARVGRVQDLAGRLAKEVKLFLDGVQRSEDSGK